jgi:hypothetical protein
LKNTDFRVLERINFDDCIAGNKEEAMAFEVIQP